MTRPPSNDPSSSGPLPLDSVAAVRRILIIEDNDELRRQLVSYFSERGWQAEAARALHAALAVATRQLPHVIITELILPDVRGYVASQLRGMLQSEVAIFAVTRLSPMIFDSARRAGYDEVFAKPVDLDTLHERIDAAVSALLARS